MRVDDVVLVRPGTRVPVDGVVVEGSAEVDESMLTGESRTISKGPGAKVVAGTVASGGSLRIRVTAVGEGTALSGIMGLVASAQASGSRTQALADRAAAILFYVAVASGAITMTYWWLAGDRAHRPHHCLPARVGPGDSARYRDFNIARSREWPPGQRPARA